MAVTPRLDEAAPNDRAAWDELVASRDGGVFCSWAWADVLERAFGYLPARFVARDDGGDVIAVFSGAITARGRFVASPAADYSDALSADPGAGRWLLERAEERMMREGRFVAIHTRNDHVSPRLSTSHDTDTFVLRTDTPFEKVWAEHIDRKTRNLVRKAEKGGIEVKRTERIPDRYLDIYFRTMRRLAFPPLPRAFYGALRETLGESLTFYGAYHDGNLVAGLVTIRFGSRLHVWGNASLDDARQLAPNDALYARAIEDACSGGIEVIDLGSSATGSSHARFKRGFGGTPVPIFTLSSGARGGGGALDAVRGAVCRRTPLALQDALGSSVYKYLY